jgi:putative membrane protein
MISIKSLLLGLTASLPIFLASNVFAQQRCDYVRWGMGLCMMGGWGMSWFSMIFMLVFWVLVIVGLVFLIIRQVQATKSEKDVFPSIPQLPSDHLNRRDGIY